MSTRMACSAATKWRSNSRLASSAHWRSSSTRTTGWCCDDRGQQTDHGREEQVTLGVGVGGLRRWEVADAADQGRDQPGQFRPVDFDVGKELVLGSVGDVVADGFGEELVGGGQVLLAVAEQNTGPTVEGDPCCIGHERGLAQTGLARDEHHLAPLPRGDALVGIGDRRHLGLASDHAHGGAQGEARGERDGAGIGPVEGLPDDFHGLQRGRADPSSDRGPSERHSCRLRRPAIKRTTSAARTCPVSQMAHRRAASTTGSPK